MKYCLCLAVVILLILDARAQETGDSLALAAEPSAIRTATYPWLSHPAYEYFDRVETRERMSLRSRIRPYLVSFGSSADASTRRTWSKEDGRFASEALVRSSLVKPLVVEQPSGWSSLSHSLFRRVKFLRWVYSDGFHLAHARLNEGSTRSLAITVQPVYGFESIDTDDYRSTITRFTSGARLEGGYAGKVRLMVDFRDHTEMGNGPYDSRDSLYEDRWASVDLKGNSSTSYDISESFIQYYGHDFSIAAGRGRHEWGPRQFGSLILNSYAPPFDYVRFDAVLEDERTPRAIYYAFLHGFLESATPAETLYVFGERPRTINAQKYLSAQRVEVRPRSNLLLGLSQAVVYGDRGLQLGYFTPLNFLYSVQHSNDDKDNFVLGMDGTWRIMPGFKVHGEVFFDDIIVKELTQSTASNKSAYTVGAQGILPRNFWSKFDFRVEYTKVRPFVYSHTFATNTYSHWTSPLGYTREPNSEYMTGELRATFYPVQFTLHASRQNHGANTADRNVGGDINQPNVEGNEGLFPFLAGKFQRTTRLGLRASWELLPNLFLFGEGVNISQSRTADRFETHAGFAWNL